MLKQATVDAMGSYSLCVQDNFKPAFVLNVSRANIKGVSGNGIVRFFDVKEFTIDDILIKAKPDITVLTFKAQSDPAKTFTLRY